MDVVLCSEGLSGLDVLVLFLRDGSASLLHLLLRTLLMCCRLAVLCLCCVFTDAVLNLESDG